MWILLAGLCASGCFLEQIPGSYNERARCEEAAKIILDAPPWAARFAVCIPAPDDILYE